MTILQVKHMTHYFGGLRAVNDYNLEIESGQVRGLIGPNGAGKTTIFNLITGIFKPSEGEVQLEGQNLVGLRPHQIVFFGLGKDIPKPALVAPYDCPGACQTGPLF